jgi:glycosyltransferase involved in cell wall biosynthesis
MDGPVNVLHLATFDTHGGAAVAAIRLVESLRRRGHDARLLVREKATAHPHVEALAREGGAPAAPRADPAVAQLAWLFTQRARSTRSDTPFSSDLPACDVAGHPAVRAADVLHLHWVTGFLSAGAIRRLQDFGKPIVWTLHDEFPFTGGCHYADRCRDFTGTCARCPQLEPGAQGLARLTLADKRDRIDPRRLALAAPSRWLATRARESALFRKARIDVVPYGIDVAARRTISPDAARTALGIPADAVVVFASSVNHRETRKGDAHLVDALGLLHASRFGRTAGLDRRLLVLTAGAGAADGDVGGFTGRALGALAADDPRLSMAYRAADVFMLPSLADNLPNTLLEAMAAGVPVVAYRTGGIPDFVEDGRNGRLVRRGDVQALADALAALVGDAPLRRRLGDAAGATAVARFDWPIQAEAYERIYRAEVGHLADRKVRPAKKPPRADATRIRALLTDRAASRLFTTLLTQEVADLQRLTAARGGEIRDLRAALAMTEPERQRETAELQEMIASQGGEIRELKRALGEARQGGARHRAVLGHLMRARDDSARARAGRLTVGIFGVGDGGRRALEAAVLLDCTIGWLSDNNPDARGRTDLECEVIAPDRIPHTPFDAIVIGSVHRDAIRAQLLALGIAKDRVVAPDVSRSDAELFDELRRLLAPHHSVRSSGRRRP